MRKYTLSDGTFHEVDVAPLNGTPDEVARASAERDRMITEFIVGSPNAQTRDYMISLVAHQTEAAWWLVL